jgi:hypothetical protein
MDRERGEVHNETYSKEEILSILSDMPQTVEESWELEFERSTENTQDEIDWLISTVDRLVGRLTDSDKQELFRQKGETIKDYIKEHGFDSATTLIVVMKR